MRKPQVLIFGKNAVTSHLEDSTKTLFTLAKQLLRMSYVRDIKHNPLDAKRPTTVVTDPYRFVMEPKNPSVR